MIQALTDINGHLDITPKKGGGTIYEIPICSTRGSPVFISYDFPDILFSHPVPGLCPARVSQGASRRLVK